jgi:hypothetical protein
MKILASGQDREVIGLLFGSASARSELCIMSDEIMDTDTLTVGLATAAGGIQSDHGEKKTDGNSAENIGDELGGASRMGIEHVLPPVFVGKNITRTLPFRQAYKSPIRSARPG